MKYALFDFYTEETWDVGLSEFIEGVTDADCNNTTWNCRKTVYVMWPKNGKATQHRGVSPV